MRSTLLLAASALLISSCNNVKSTSAVVDSEYRSSMRSLITSINDSMPINLMKNNYVIINNGLDIVYRSATNNTVEYNFTRSVINGAVQTDLYRITGTDTIRQDSLLDLFTILKSSDYANSLLGSVEQAFDSEMKDSLFNWNNKKGLITYIVGVGDEYNTVQDTNANGFDSITTNRISELKNVKNFLLLSDTIAEVNSSENSLVELVENSDHDLVIIRPEIIVEDTSGNDIIYTKEFITSSDVISIGTKKTGSDRLVLCELNLSQADTSRYYWKNSWNDTLPTWMTATSDGAVYKVDFRNSEWRSALLEPISLNKASYIRQIINAGFDGVYLTGIEAFQEFEIVGSDSSDQNKFTL